MIEEKDIKDLDDALYLNGLSTKVIDTYQRLRMASGNHLRAFNMHARARDIHYIPRYISEAEYNSIIQE